ncbi:MAG: DNA cytosine methyltransferase [Rhodospirillales bacterium]|nr:DNA cytosine methyltransferase [Rhodospirillales bacterium]
MNPYLLRRAQASRAKFKRTAVDLFSGAGGLTLGLLNANFDVRLCVDRDSACEATHHRNFPSIPFLKAGVENLTGPDVLSRAGLRPGELDLLVGGPPCQGFSIIGQRELFDPRNGLFRHFLRIAAELRPKAIIIENVTGLATLSNGAVLNDIGAAFNRAGYNVDCAELLAAQYGVPQMRWRMFFIGWRMDQPHRGGFPLPTHGRAGIGDLVPNRTISDRDSAGFVTIRDAIGDLPRIGTGETAAKYTRKPFAPYQEAMRAGTVSDLHNHYAARLSQQNITRIEFLKPGEDWRALPRDLLPAGMKKALRKDHTRRYRRMKWDGIARSIITRFRDPKSGEYTHPDQHRTISIREAARIQSFPDWFVFEGGNTQQYDQVGNAVPPLLARAVAKEIYRRLFATAAVEEVQVKSRYRIPALLGLDIAAV